MRRNILVTFVVFLVVCASGTLLFFTTRQQRACPLMGQEYTSDFIQSKINNQLLGGTVSICPGKYVVTHTILIPSGLTLEGIGDVELTAQNMKGPVIYNDAPDLGNSNITIKHLRIFVQNSEDIGLIQYADGIRFYNVTNSQINDITVEGTAGSAVDIKGSNINVKNVTGIKNAEHGIVLRKGSGNINIETSNISKAGNHGIQIEDGDGIYIHHTTVSESKKNGISGVTAKNVRLEYDNINNNGWSGIDFENIESSAIENNQSHGNHLNGIVVEQSLLNDVWKPSRNVRISSNTIYENGWAGITIQESERIQVISNKSWNNSVERSGLGALVYIKYDLERGYHEGHRCHNIIVAFNSYDDNRPKKLSSYGVAVNGTSNEEIGGDNILVFGNIIHGVTESKIRLQQSLGNNNLEFANL